MTDTIEEPVTVAQQFVRKFNRLSRACKQPLVVFGISLKARTTDGKWAIVQDNLFATIASIEKQTDTNFVIAIAGHDKPDFGRFGKNVCWLEAEWTPPSDTAQYSNDKQKKRRLILSALRKTLVKNFYFFTMDADDFLDPNVVKHIRSDHNRAGYYIDKGYIYDAPSGALALMSTKTVPFHKRCGSCAAFWVTRDDLPTSISDTTTMWHRLLDHTAFPEAMEALGRPISAIPFAGGLYFLNHGASNVREKGTGDRKAQLANRKRLSPEETASVLARFSVPRQTGATEPSVGGGAPAWPPISKKNPLLVRFSENGRVRHNWGDKLNRTLAEALSRRAVVNGGQRGTAVVTDTQTYVCIGSSMSTVRPDEIVWGTGYISYEAKVAAQPRRICSVRGPMTRARLLEQGYECPEVYGDAALLYPLIYKPAIEPRYEYGVIPHFKDKDEEVMPLMRGGEEPLVIDIMGGIEEVVDQILSCRRILSSSLHGIIAAHSYGVPATWIKFGDRPLGDGFKFQDYWASVGVRDVEPVLSPPGSFCEDLVGPDRPRDPLVDPRTMIAVCPFIHDTVRRDLLARVETEGLGLLCKPHRG